MILHMPSFKPLKVRLSPWLIVPVLAIAAAFPLSVIISKDVTLTDRDREMLAVSNDYPYGVPCAAEAKDAVAEAACRFTMDGATVPDGWSVAFSSRLCLGLAYPPDWEAEIVGDTPYEFMRLKAGEHVIATVGLGVSLNGYGGDLLKVGGKQFQKGSEFCYDDYEMSTRRCTLSVMAKTDSQRLVHASMDGFEGEASEEYEELMGVLSSIQAP